MHVRKLDFETFSREYGVQSLRLYPWQDVVAPPFGSMWSLVEPGGSTSRHNHHEAETFVVMRGAGSIRVDDRTTPLASGDVVYVPPFSNHTITNTSADDGLLILAVYWEDMALARSLAASGGEAQESSTRALLVTATPPTVNGDLHLGHLAGPYVAADVYARFERMRGRRVFYVSGADDHQSYVPTKAQREGSTPRQLADDCAARIERSLRAAGVALDHFARPSRSEHHAATVQQLFQRLYEAGDIHAVRAPSLWCEGCDRYLFEAHVSGTCPHCGSGSDGCACEACGRPNDCVDLVEPHCKACGAPAGVREVERLYFRLGRYEGELRRYYEDLELTPHMTALVSQMLSAGLPDVAVSHLSDWGLPVPVEGFEGQRIYVWFEMAPGYLAATQEVCEASSGDGSDAGDAEAPGGWESLWKSPDAEVVQFFGYDNGWFHAVLFPAVWKAFDRDIRLPSAFVTNEFYLLDGEKFSTSRGHAIWAADFLAREPADFVRFYLSWDRPEVRQTSFNEDRYRAAIQSELLDTWQGWLRALGETVREEYAGEAPVTGGYTGAHRAYLGQVDAAIRSVAEALTPPHFSPARAVRVLCELVRGARELASADEYIKGVPERSDYRRTAVALELSTARTLAMLAAPIMPAFSADLRRALGFADADAAPTWSDDPEFLPGGQDVRGLCDFAFPASSR